MNVYINQSFNTCGYTKKINHLKAHQPGEESTKKVLTLMVWLLIKYKCTQKISYNIPSTKETTLPKIKQERAFEYRYISLKIATVKRVLRLWARNIKKHT